MFLMQFASEHEVMGGPILLPKRNKAVCLQAARDPIKACYFPDGMPGTCEFVSYMDGHGSCQSLLSLYRASESHPRDMPLSLRRTETLLRQGKYEKGDLAHFTVFANNRIQVRISAFVASTRQDA